MIRFTLKELEEIRKRKHRLSHRLKVRTEDEAVNFIEECGFLPLFKIKKLELPSLAEATKPRRGEDWVYNAWEWKNILPEKKRCAYAKIIHKKGTFISWEFYPKFLAIYGPRGHYLDDYYAGKLSRIEKRILEILEEKGPMDTDALRARVGLPGKKGTAEFHRCLEDLQASFRVTIAGGRFDIGWGRHIWDLVDRWAPEEILNAAYSISPQEAMKDIILKYLDTVIISTTETIARTFKWSLPAVEKIVEELTASKSISPEASVAEMQGKFLARLQK